MISPVMFSRNSYAIMPQKPILRDKSCAVNTPETRQTVLPFYQISFKSGKITKLAHRLYKKACRSSMEFNEITNRVFGNNLERIRIKSIRSIICKIKRKKGKVDSFKDTPKLVNDVLGAKGVTDGSQKQTDEIVKSLVKEVKNGNLTITNIGNYYARGSRPYLSAENLESLQKAQKQPINMPKNYNWGYTTANIKFKTKNNLLGEFQLKGKHCRTLDAPTHLTYELKARRLKPTGTCKEEKEVLIEAYSKLDNQQLADLNRYQVKFFKHKRLKELGKETHVPKRPKNLPEVFDMDHLTMIARLLRKNSVS